MAGGENEVIAPDPARLIGIMTEKIAVKHRAHFRAAKRKTEMAGLRRFDCVHGETARFSGGAGERFEIQIHPVLYSQRRARQIVFDFRFNPAFDTNASTRSCIRQGNRRDSFA